MNIVHGEDLFVGGGVWLCHFIAGRLRGWWFVRVIERMPHDNSIGHCVEIMGYAGAAFLNGVGPHMVSAGIRVCGDVNEVLAAASGDRP